MHWHIGGGHHLQRFQLQGCHGHGRHQYVLHQPFYHHRYCCTLPDAGGCADPFFFLQPLRSMRSYTRPRRLRSSVATARWRPHVPRTRPPVHLLVHRPRSTSSRTWLEPFTPTEPLTGTLSKPFTRQMTACLHSPRNLAWAELG